VEFADSLGASLTGMNVYLETQLERVSIYAGDALGQCGFGARGLAALSMRALHGNLDALSPVRQRKIQRPAATPGKTKPLI
jgi:hypothetical protein